MGATERGAVLVTGSSTGIGRACALRLDDLGFRVFAGVRKRGHAEELAEVASERLEPVILDVTDEGTIEVTRERVEQETGGRLAGLVNNAGVAVAGPLESVPLDDLRRQLEVNVVGQVAVTQAFLPMLRAARGRVIFMGSISGRLAVPFLGPYAASKHAIEALGDCLRAELRGAGVRVSVVEPGSIATPIWEKGESEAERVRARMSEEERRIYGDEVETMAEAARKTAERGIAPDKVADRVVHALTARRPRTRYLVGIDARAQALLRRIIPDRPRDVLVRRGMGI